MDKLLKTIESLKVPSAFTLSSDANIPGAITSAVVAAIDAVNVKKKERIAHCVSVTDAILTPSVQNLMDFEKIMEHVTEVLFQLCNDPDSDIRLVAVDCVNRIVRSMRGILLNKFQVEVYREIKRNQAPRSLRTALSVFATMSSDIRPNRCRSFIQSLLPSLVQISKRTEELLYENLSTSFLQILKNLGLFLTDNDVKLLCNEYMKNLESNSTVVRRSSASILIYVCQFSRKPNIFFPKLLVEVIELLMPNLMEKNVSLLIGVLLCVRQCLAPLYIELEKSFPGVVDKELVYRNIIQVYEICLILCNHDDHNVITTSLETLQQLLNCPVFEVARRLTSSEGIKNSFNSEQWVPKTQGATPPLYDTQWTSVRSELSEPDEPSAAFLIETELDLPAFRSELSSTSKDDDLEMNISFSGARRDSDVFIMASTSEAESESENSLEPDLEQSDSQRRTDSFNAITIETFPELQIGSLYEKNVPLYYCTRFLAYNFLLAGRKGYERSDNEVRVTVKVLAINCIVNSIRLCPAVYSLPVSPADAEGEDLDKQQKISDVSLYARHHDPLLRGSTFVLIGNYIRCSLRASYGVFPGSQLEIEGLIAILNTGLLDKSNIGVKYALSGLGECLSPIFKNKAAPSAAVVELFENFFRIISNPYWLVKVNLIELLAGIEWDTVKRHDQMQGRTLNLLLHLLSDEDLRVRSSTTSGLIKFIQSCANREAWITGNLNNCYSRSVIDIINCDMFKLPEKTYFHSEISKELEKVLNRIIPLLRGLSDKHSLAGFYMALASLSESFPPITYKSSWRCGGDNIPVIFSIAVELLRFSPIISDLTVHQNLLTLSSNILLALVDSKTESPDDNISPFVGSRKNVSSHGLYLLHHSFSVVKLYNSILSSSQIGTTNLALKKQSPVLSPAKKFMSKDSDKKVAESESDKKVQRQQSIPPGTPGVCAIQLKRIEESLQQSWKVYKSNLDPVVTHKFTSVLVTALGTLGSVFDCTKYEYAGITSIIEDILALAPVIFILAPVSTLRCMKSILRCLNSPYPPAEIDFCAFSSENVFLDFQTFCDNFYINLAASRKCGFYQPPSEKSGLGTHIRSFEPIVISALKTYLASSDSSIQAEILLFVSELIKGHVNYAMVDSSTIFLNCVTKQLTFLEEGHVRNPALVVDAIFEYFTQLAHMERGKKFIDTPKIFQLCDGLAASGQNPATNYVPALKKIVHDLFIRRANFGITNLEKKEVEAQREVLFQNILKLGHVPDALPVIFVLLHGRRGLNEAKWSTESGIVGKSILDSIESNKLVIENLVHFYCVIGIIFSVHVVTLPSMENIKLRIERTLLVEVNDPVSLKQWMIAANSFWLVTLRLIYHNEDNTVCGKMLLELLVKFVDRTGMIFTWAKGSIDEGFLVEQLVVFLKTSASILRKGVSEESVFEFTHEEKLEDFTRSTCRILNISKSYPGLRRAFYDFLAVTQYPHLSVWTLSLSYWSPSEPNEEFVSNIILSLIENMTNGSSPEQEAWLRKSIAKLLSQSDMLDLFATLDSTNTNVYDMLRQSVTKIESTTNLLEYDSLCKVFLKTLTTWCDDSEMSMAKPYCALACLELLLSDKAPCSTLHDYAQFTSFLVSLLLQDQPQLELVHEEYEIIRGFKLDKLMLKKYPRLCSLVGQFEDKACRTQKANLNLKEEEDGDIRQIVDYDPLIDWINRSSKDPMESRAIAQVLLTTFAKEMERILNEPSQNLNYILKHIFKLIRSMNGNGDASVDTKMLIPLLSGVKSPPESDGFQYLASTALTKVEHILDSLEASITEKHLVPVTSNHVLTPAVYCLPNYNLGYFCEVWNLLTEVLLLKASVQPEMTPTEMTCQNNYVPTKVFVYSFQLLRLYCEADGGLTFEELDSFFEFASLSIRDHTLLHFLNVRNHTSDIFTCVFSLGAILRSILAQLCVPFIPSETDGSWADLTLSCKYVLEEFEFFYTVLSQVENGKIHINATLTSLIRNLVSGLGRLELINNWLLISHLGWRPHYFDRLENFPVICQIPFELLHNDKDLLLKYARKIVLFGTVSKVQFEENWMMFLSIINSLSDDQCDAQFVVFGLDGLKKMLEQNVQVAYMPDFTANKEIMGLKNVNRVLKEIEPEESCDENELPEPNVASVRRVENEFGIDATSCVRLLMDVFSQWFDNHQLNMSTGLKVQIMETVMAMSKYFEDESQFTWMFKLLSDVYKKQEKDELYWRELVKGIFVAAARIELDHENHIAFLSTVLKESLSIPYIEPNDPVLEGVLIFFQHQLDSQTLINIIIPYLAGITQLKQTEDGHNHAAWKLQLFIWLHCHWDSTTSFEQDLIPNILTALSFMNKVQTPIRVLILNALIRRVEIGHLKPNTKQKITKVALDTLKTPIPIVFFQALKLFITIFYSDFSNFYGVSDPGPEVLMEMAERSEIFFRLLKDENRMSAEISSAILPLLVKDFLPASEILNRVISEFLSPAQTSPEFLAQTVSAIFQKAHRDPKDALLVREWVKASLPHFISSPDVFRTMWSLAIIFFGVASPETYSSLYTYTTFKANAFEVKKLFGKSVVAYCDMLDCAEQHTFLTLIQRGGIGAGASCSSGSSPYKFAIKVLRESLFRRTRADSESFFRECIGPKSDEQVVEDIIRYYSISRIPD